MDFLRESPWLIYLREASVFDETRKKRVVFVGPFFRKRGQFGATLCLSDPRLGAYHWLTLKGTTDEIRGKSVGDHLGLAKNT